ncbi:hypothetical protein BH18ACI5_BH18ACI5_01920 [soil metagenome]
MSKHTMTTIITTAFLVCSSFTTHSAAIVDPVLEWNQIAINATVTATQGPLPQGRSMTIVQVAVHDAVNVITQKHATYLSYRSAAAGATPEAAAVAAAHRSLVTLFPTQAAALNAARTASLAARGLTEDDPGIVIGETAAASVLAARATDGAAQAQFAYTAPHAGDPGVWVAIGTTAIARQRPLRTRLQRGSRPWGSQQPVENGGPN